MCLCACVNLNLCSVPEVYQVLGGQEAWVLQWHWRQWLGGDVLRPVSLSDHVSSWLPGWPAVTPQPAADWELVFCGRTRCTWQKWKWLSERTAPEDLNTCKNINGQAHSYSGKFHLGRVWFLAHFLQIQTPNERVQLFYGLSTKTLII